MNGYPGYQVIQYNIIIDILGGHSREVEHNSKELVGDNSKTTILQMQKSSVLSNYLHLANLVGH